MQLVSWLLLRFLMMNKINEELEPHLPCLCHAEHWYYYFSDSNQIMSTSHREVLLLLAQFSHIIINESCPNAIAWFNTYYTCTLKLVVWVVRKYPYTFLLKIHCLVLNAIKREGKKFQLREMPQTKTSSQKVEMENSDI